MHDSQSRQKSCNLCALIKRRCDRRKPTCSRCAEKGVACSYTKPRVAGRPRREQTELSTSSMGTTEYELAADPSYTSLCSPESTYRMPPGDSSSSLSAAVAGFFRPWVADAPVDNGLMDPFVTFAGHSVDSIAPGPIQWNMPVEHEPMVERPRSLVDDHVMRSYSKMARICKLVEPWDIHDRSTALYYIVNCLKGFTTSVATRNAAPFMHRCLYKHHMPQCILSCFTTNVLYANRTPENARMVTQAIHNSARELLASKVNHTTTRPVEQLAQTQALFLYQIIRLLDGDVSLRAQGERDIPVLRGWLEELCKVRENKGGVAELGNTSTREQSSGAWEAWIFAESVRRTIIMSYSFLKLYEMMKGSDNIDDTWSFAHRWTLSRHLWDAETSSEFSRMWQEKPRFIITNFAFQHFLTNGSGADVDEFGEILLSMYLGVEETRRFLAEEEYELLPQAK